jgi:hypothetical protein
VDAGIKKSGAERINEIISTMSNIDEIKKLSNNDLFKE